MDQLKQILARLSLRQKITIVISALAVIGAIVGLQHWNRERDFKPIFTGLASEDAGAMVAKIRESGVEYRLAEGGSAILVPSGRVAELRLQLAVAGLPKSGRIGYEIFDKTTFGATEFAEQINFHRAIEGELERSVMSLADVEQARVHVTFPKDSVFLESKQPAKASVLIKLKPGGKLSPQNVVAIAHLAASAVDGLTPEAVSVLDMRGNLLSRPRKNQGDAGDISDSALEYRQQVEKDLLVKINSTLEPMMGAEKFRANVSADCDLTSGEQSEETYDPTRSVMTTSQRTEDTTSAATASGIPGSASNLPRPPARPAAGSAGFVRRTENVAYQSSRTVKHLKLPQGTIKRLSVSVLVDQNVRWEGSGAKAKRIIEPPSAEKLKVIREVVAGVAGILPDRDLLVVDTFPFESTLNAEPMPVALPVTGVPDTWLRKLLTQPTLPVIAGIGVGAILALAVIVVVVMRRSAAKVEIAAAIPAAKATKEAIEAPDSRDVMDAALTDRAALQAAMDAETLGSLKLPEVTSKKAEVLAKYISSEVKKDPETMAHIIRTWLNATE